MNSEKIKNLLLALNASVKTIEDSAVVLSDGFVIASHLEHNIDEEKLGTISAALFGMANKAAQQFEKDEAQHILIKCNRSYIAMFKIDANAALFVDFAADAKFDSIISEAMKSCQLLAEFV